MAPPRRAGPSRLAAFLALATAAQLAFWWLATPGPVLLGGAQRSPETAFAAVGWSLATLLLAALAAPPLAGVGLRRAGFAWGRAGRWTTLAAALALLAAPVLWSQAADPALASTYPWTGVAWLAGGPERWLIWTASYAAYYLAFEAFYRGAVLHVLRGPLGDVGANAAQAMLATLIHVGKPAVEAVGAFPASLLFGWLTLRSRSLLPAIVLHLAIGVTMDAAVVWRATP